LLHGFTSSLSIFNRQSIFISLHFAFTPEESRTFSSPAFLHCRVISTGASYNSAQTNRLGGDKDKGPKATAVQARRGDHSSLYNIPAIYQRPYFLADGVVQFHYYRLGTGIS